MPISGLSGAPPETIALSRPPKRRRSLGPHQPVEHRVGEPLAEVAQRLEGGALAADRDGTLKERAGHSAFALDPEQDAAGALSRRGAAPRS